MIRHKMSAGARVLALSLMSLPASAVTVDIHVTSEGKPVPVTAITFETPDGEQISTIELVEVPEEVAPQEDAPVAENQPGPAPDGETAQQSAGQPEAPGEESPRPAFIFKAPDALTGDKFVIVVRKDGKVVKKEPVTLDRNTASIAIEAYDPSDAVLALDMAQPEICRRGQTCAYELTVTNQGNGIYAGPLFLTGQLYGTIAPSEPKSDGWLCLYAGSGQQICYANQSLQPGESQTSTLVARLPGQLPQSASNCLEISRRTEEPAGRSEPILQAIQVGLAATGINAGRPDGVMGQKIQVAIGRFAGEQGLGPAAPLENVFVSLFGMRPDRLARLGLAKPQDCEKLALVPPLKQKKLKQEKKQISKSRQPKRSSGDGDNARDESVDPAISIGIGLGVFGGKHKKKHKKYEQKWEE